MMYILVDTGILLREGFEPHDIPCRSAHDDIEMAGPSCEGIGIMAEDMSFREEDLDYVLCLAEISDPSLMLQRRGCSTLESLFADKSSH